MKKTIKIVLLLVLVCLAGLPISVFAEDKFQTAGIVTKLTAEEMKDAPEFKMVSLYPPWGVPCTNFSYYVSYKDNEGRSPAYVRIWLNGAWHDMNKISGEYKTGATYAYNVIPHSGAQLFYYFEASNGVGKARTGIIDSPNQGPVLFAEKLDNNQIILLDKTGKEVWTFDTGKDWVEGVAVSEDGKYVAAVTNYFLYLFSKDSNIPLWKFCTQCKVPEFVAGDFQGVAISSDGSYIALGFKGKGYLFGKDNNNPLWTKNIDNTIGAAISDDGDTIAFGTGNTIFIFDKAGTEIVKYAAVNHGYDIGGNFYQPAVTPDGNYIAVSTGCPDRRAYLFSKKGDVLFRSEMLTYDSPVHKSAISDDGSLIAYSADHMTGKEILFLFGKDGVKKWGFSSSEDSTARVVSISGDGKYAAIGTSAGHVYLFSTSSNNPIWKFTASGTYSQFADVKLNSDGGLLAAVSSNKNIYLFSRNSNTPLWTYKANTWVTKADFNGEYIVAGTGAREFMFEGSSLTDAEVQCAEIIQPPDPSLLGLAVGGTTAQQASAAGTKTGDGTCGDGMCEDPETKESCPKDCNPDATGVGSSLGGDTWCGNSICEPPIETKDNCGEDCNLQDIKQGVNDENSAGDCGDSMCKAPETKDTCCDDCGGCAGIVKRTADNNVDENNIDEGAADNKITPEKQKEKSNFFSAIMDFFRRFFGSKQ